MGRNNDDFLSAMGISRQEQEEMARNAWIGHNQDESEKPQTFTPCNRCGTPIPTDIHKEELGMCVDCSHKYFDGGFEEEDHSYDVPDHDMYKCGVCGKNSSTAEENMNHRCFE